MPGQRHSHAVRVLLSVALLFPTGCFRASVVDPRSPSGSRHTEWTDSFFWGLVGEPEVDVRYHCAGDAARIRAGGDPVATILSVVTLGIYTPRVVRVTCAERAARRSAGAPSSPRLFEIDRGKERP